MKRLLRQRRGWWCAAALTLLVRAEGPVEQSPMALKRAESGAFVAEWQGVAQRIYFVQWSQDLELWHYAPFIDFGDGVHGRGVHSSSVKGFFRLHWLDDPAITSLDAAFAADFDGDGLSNVFEVTFGYDPFAASSTLEGPDASLDADGDGMTNETEDVTHANPMWKDHPECLLEVSVK